MSKFRLLLLTMIKMVLGFRESSCAYASTKGSARNMPSIYLRAVNSGTHDQSKI